jgi:DNA polymerase beta
MFFCHHAHWSQLYFSRRGANTSSDMDVVLFHPSYVHIPTPSTTLLTNARQSRKRADRSSDTNRNKTSTSSNGNGNSASTQLLADVVLSLEGSGLVAATFASGPRRWQGIVRVPQQLDGEWEERTHRLAQIKQTQGMYRRMDLKSVYSPCLVLILF